MTPSARLGPVTESTTEELPVKAQALLDAVIAISTDLDLHRVLERIIVSAAELTDATYGALGVIGGVGDLVEFITTGIDPHARELIGDLPSGRGILRLLIDEPEPLRLDNLATHPKSYGFPPNHPPMTSFLGVPIRVRGTVFGNLYLTEKQGGLRFTKQDEVLVQGLASAAGFVIENARAYGLSERRRQWLEASAEVAASLQPPIDLDRALSQITTLARRTAGAAATALVQFPDGQDGRVAAIDGIDPAELEPLLPAIAEAAAVEVDGGPPREVSMGERTAVVLPLRAHLAETGALVSIFDRGQRLDDYEERELLVAFADQAGLALDRAQAFEDREELAVVSERDRIARDLHDIVIQRLFATGMRLQGLRQGASTEEVNERLAKAVDDLDLTIKDIRSTIFALQNRQSGTLRSEVRSLVKEYVPVLASTPTLRTLGPVDTAVDDEVQAHVLAVLREALSNIARHALADHVDVEIQVREHELMVQVTDDGVGLPTTVTESGLRNARRRAVGLGGSLEVLSNEPRGTILRWQVPLTRR